MKSLTRGAVLAVLGLAATALPAFAVGSGKLHDTPQFQSSLTVLAQNQCFTDDGYGRKRSCSAGYFNNTKKKKATPTTMK
jgi:hypothetical protein